MANIYAPGDQSRNWYYHQSQAKKMGGNGYSRPVGQNSMPAYWGSYQPASSANAYAGMRGVGGGSSSGGGGGGAGSNYTTSIDQNSLYGPNGIQAAVNQDRAQFAGAEQRARAALGQGLAARGFGPGGPAQRAQVASIIQNNAANSVGHARQLENQMRAEQERFRLQQQQARAQEGLGLAGLANQQKAMEFQAQQQAQNRAFGLMSGMLGNLMGGLF